MSAASLHAMGGRGFQDTFESFFDSLEPQAPKPKPEEESSDPTDLDNPRLRKWAREEAEKLGLKTDKL